MFAGESIRSEHCKPTMIPFVAYPNSTLQILGDGVKNLNSNLNQTTQNVSAS